MNVVVALASATTPGSIAALDVTGQHLMHAAELRFFKALLRIID